MSAWTATHSGAVISAAVDRYCWITCRYLPPFFQYRSRFVWSKIETVNNLHEVEHPAIRACLNFLGMAESRLEIHHNGDIPAMSGVGSSAAFTVGLLHALHALRGDLVDKSQLAAEAISIDQQLEVVGCQDHVACAYGGLNLISIEQGGKFAVTPLSVKNGTLTDLQQRLMLFYTGRARIARLIEQDKISRTLQLDAIYAQVELGLTYLRKGRLDDFGALLNDAWESKRQLSPLVSTEFIDDCYSRALRAGALGGKLTGAGGGGCLLLYVPEAAQEAVRQALVNLVHIPFRFDFGGSRLVYYEPTEEEECGND